MKKALITGVAGMAGSHLADILLENTNWNVYGRPRSQSRLENVSHLFDRVVCENRMFLENADLYDRVV